MKKKQFFISTLVCLLLMPVGLVVADEDEGRQAYGWQLMTQQEREQHRMKMQSMETREEREAYRKEQHEMMEQRAKERGITLPDDPRERGRGMGGGRMMDDDDDRDMRSGGRGMGSGGGRR